MACRRRHFLSYGCGHRVFPAGLPIEQVLDEYSLRSSKRERSSLAFIISTRTEDDNGGGRHESLRLLLLRN